MPGSCDLLVVSHACVLAENQRVYAELATRGADVRLVVPARWRDPYRPEGYAAQVAEGLEGRVTELRVLGAGRPQRHVHLARARSVLASLGPRAVLIEEEPFSLAASQWSSAARHAGVPFGVQLAETMDRALPRAVATMRDRVLSSAAFVLARSPGAAALASHWGASGAVVVVAHGVDDTGARPTPDGAFTVAYVGRLVEVKGVLDLLEAVRSLDGAVRLVVAGDGPLAGAVRDGGAHVEYLGAVRHEGIGEVYARAHATCVPSRTSATWEEQFGRVLVESLVRAVPVVATRTGEIPWVVASAGGGVLVEQRDPAGLAAALGALAADRERAEALGAQGRAGALATFTNAAAAGQIASLLGGLSAPR